MTYKFIHIGKSSGTTLKYLFNFKNRGHPKMIFSKSYKYILWLRNPINRLVSAFNFAKYIIDYDTINIKAEDLNIHNCLGIEVITSFIKKNKTHKFNKEFDELIHSFKNVDHFLSSLSSDNMHDKKNAELLISCCYNKSGVQFFKSLGYHLDNKFIKHCNKNNLFIGTVENMQKDINRLSKWMSTNKKLDREILRKNINYSTELSEISVKNAIKFLKKDYNVLNLLHKKKMIDESLLKSYYTYDNIKNKN